MWSHLLSYLTCSLQLPLNSTSQNPFVHFHVSFPSWLQTVNLRLSLLLDYLQLQVVLCLVISVDLDDEHLSFVFERTFLFAPIVF